MSQRGSLKINLLSSWGAHVVTLAIGFFLMPYVLRTLGDSTYGTWIFINSIASYSGLMYLGFGTTISRFVATYVTQQDWRKLNGIINAGLAVFLGMGAVTLLLSGTLALLAPRLHEWDPQSLGEIPLVILILGVNVAIGLVGSVFGGVLLGIQRFDLERTIQVTTDLVRVGLTFLFLSGQWPLVTLSLIFLVATVLEVAAYVVLSFRLVPQLAVGMGHLTRETFGDCFGFSFFTFVGHIANQLIYATDAIVIGCVLGKKAIVPYYIGQRLSEFLRRPIQQIGEVCMPKMGALHARAELAKLRELVIQSVGLAFLLSASLLMGAAYFGDVLIRNWVGGGYQESHRLMLVLLVAQVVGLPMGVLRSTLFGMGQVKVPALLYLVEAVANLVLSLILVEYWGTLGVALGTALPIVGVELFVLLPYVCRQLDMSPRSLIYGVLGKSIGPLLGLWMYCEFVERSFHIYQGWGLLIVVAACGGGVLGAMFGLQFLIAHRERVLRHWNLFA